MMATLQTKRRTSTLTCSTRQSRHACMQMRIRMVMTTMMTVMMRRSVNGTFGSVVPPVWMSYPVCMGTRSWKSCCQPFRSGWLKTCRGRSVRVPSLRSVLLLKGALRACGPTFHSWSHTWLRSCRQIAGHWFVLSLVGQSAGIRAGLSASPEVQKCTLSRCSRSCCNVSWTTTRKCRRQPARRLRPLRRRPSLIWCRTCVRS
mmetsp:Transcript_14577/g.25995  ORF Transcript_14577/g.25995 Transcript_14577/m.25995 type:complete len:202 (-) Transcript_14577:2111-2716(-)